VESHLGSTELNLRLEVAAMVGFTGTQPAGALYKILAEEELLAHLVRTRARRRRLEEARRARDRTRWARIACGSLEPFTLHELAARQAA
jgi:hypothetical protein